MTDSQSHRPVIRLVTVLAFLISCVVFIVYLWIQAGGYVPGLAADEDEEYHVSVDIPDVDNLVPFTDVAIAGVNVGKVSTLDRTPDAMRVRMRMNPEVAPLHNGVTVQVSEKSLVGQPYLRVVDGRGAEIPNGARLPDSAVKPSVQLHDVLESLNPQTRQALGKTLRSLGAGTAGTHKQIAQLMDGLGALGNEGHTALDAVAAQSSDLKHFATQLTAVLRQLNSGRDDIGRLVDSGNQLATATANQRGALEATMRELPATLGTARTATGSLRGLAGSLTPVAADLRRAAPDLNGALNRLPAATRDLRGLLPSLNTVLDRAPATLDRVPALAADAGTLIPQLAERLRDLNPMLRYLSPYGRDIGAFIANFGASFAHKTSDGKNVLALFAVANEQSVRGNPLNLGRGVLTGHNAYPAPGTQGNRAPFSGAFPRLYKDPK